MKQILACKRLLPASQSLGEFYESSSTVADKTLTFVVLSFMFAPKAAINYPYCPLQYLHLTFVRVSWKQMKILAMKL